MRLLKLIGKGFVWLGCLIKKAAGVFQMAKAAYDYVATMPFCLHAKAVVCGIEGYVTVRSEKQPASTQEYKTQLVIEKPYGLLVFLGV